ncbi:MAG: hypothetical protein HKN20_15335, partial [Gemmatimonadetes bacterium]|nr:hypothetical protein [Gemmatimonadota bacterium]
FIDDHFSAAYLARKTKDELLGYYHRLLRDHVGTVTARGVVDASSDRVVLRVEGALGREAEFHFTLDADGRIDDMMVAVIDGAPRRQ